MLRIAPSILSADFSNLIGDINKVQEAGVDLLHIDVMDGHFVPNISIGPLVVDSIKDKTNIPFDVHLMIEDPDKYIESFISPNVEIITVHIEACRHLNRTIQNIKSLGKKVGVALNPATPNSLLENVLEDIDMVLLMSVNPGFGGQKFIKSTIKKIKELKKITMDRNLNIDIQVDGGIKLDNVGEVVNAGANIIVAGSAIFNSNDITKTVRDFREKMAIL